MTPEPTNPPTKDSKTTETIIMFLGFNATIGVTGLFGLAFLGRDVNAALYTLVGGLVGALGALLTQTRANQNRGTDATSIQSDSTTVNSENTTVDASATMGNSGAGSAG